MSSVPERISQRLLSNGWERTQRAIVFDSVNLFTARGNSEIEVDLDEDRDYFYVAVRADQEEIALRFPADCCVLALCDALAAATPPATIEEAAPLILSLATICDETEALVGPDLSPRHLDPVSLSGYLRGMSPNGGHRLTDKER